MTTRTRRGGRWSKKYLFLSMFRVKNVHVEVGDGQKSAKLCSFSHSILPCVSLIFQANLKNYHYFRFRSFHAFIFKICETVAGMSITSQFHEYYFWRVFAIQPNCALTPGYDQEMMQNRCENELLNKQKWLLHNQFAKSDKICKCNYQHLQSVNSKQEWSHFQS